ncbi:hypothetical protein [Akkermansia sp.]|uniref:hypothetical protein n=1 Tax=Akkermansia sp. TaxID=1872421 RepID=UPI0025C3E877|nr:hypothetical protein [Akkermansia sp.]MCC8147603.1 hypothetical protein [Akkermansia sp.]
MPMCYHCLICLAVFCFAPVSGAVAGKESPEEPGVTVSLDEWHTRQTDPGEASSASQSFSMNLKVREISPSWKVAYEDEDGSEVTMADSEGSSPSKLSCSYNTAFTLEKSDRAGTIFLSTDSWLPSEGARWVEARGKIPLIMYSKAAVSESVTLKTMVKDFSVPLVLKDAGIDGAEVKAELKGYYDEGGNDEDGHILRIRVFSTVPFGFLAIELYSGDGTPLLEEDYGSGSGRSPGSYNWHQFFRVKGEKKKEVKVSVNYAAGLRKILAPFHARCGLFGVMEQQDTQHKEG